MELSKLSSTSNCCKLGNILVAKPERVKGNLMSRTLRVARTTVLGVLRSLGQIFSIVA